MTAGCRLCSSPSHLVHLSKERRALARLWRYPAPCWPVSVSILCLLANTAPVAFGSIGTPVLTLANVTGLPLLALSSMIGRLCALLSVIIPGYLMVVMVGRKKALQVLP